MPWSPSFDSAVADPRLDAYRDRAAHLTDSADIVGYVLIESDFSADLTGGVLWWRRWAPPKEFAIVFTRFGDAEPRTTGVGNDDLDLFKRWATDGYADDGRVLSVEWLGDAESQRVHDEVFAHQH